MTTVVFGNGNLGRAIAIGLVAQGEPGPRVLGRPAGGRHRTADLIGTDLVFEASRGDALVDNLSIAVAAGCRRFVVATTGWDDDRLAIDQMLRDHGASAVFGSNFSLGVAVFLRIIEVATELFGRLDGYDPYIVEWHRREKLDRPSGTALEIARRLLARHPSKARIADPSGPPAADELEVVSLRAGSSPGVHMVGFDASGESVELRLAARDRSAYVAGALASAAWLRREVRSPGIHPFADVLEDLIGDAPSRFPVAREVALAS